jgi:hypothetical protein
MKVETKILRIRRMNTFFWPFLLFFELTTLRPLEWMSGSGLSKKHVEKAFDRNMKSKLILTERLCVKHRYCDTKKSPNYIKNYEVQAKNSNIAMKT